MNDQPDYSGIPMQPGEPLSEADQRLSALFAEMDKNQFEFLDQAGKRIIELSTALLGVLFAVTAFGDTFPPPYLVNAPFTQWLGVGVLGALVLALLCGVLTVQPRRYTHYESNLTEMRREWAGLFAAKAKWMRRAHWLFFAGAGLLALLIGALLLSA